MSYEHLLVDVADAVATITINRPETRNSLTIAATQELVDVLQSVGDDKAIRAVILTGTGKGFCSGADLMELSQKSDADIGQYLRDGLNLIIAYMRNMEKPVICAINGVAAGAGASLPLAADYRLASENASFVFAAFVNLGLIPDAGGTLLLPQLVGQAKALELALLADAKNRVSAQESLELGLVNRLVSHDALMSEAAALADKLAKMPTRAIAMIKQAIYTSYTRTPAEALEYEAQLQAQAARTQDFEEGVAAFLEKREPNFKGE